ncbi:MAG TPA: hypothetical protein VHA74_00950, partial [Candidatus Dojkabacteria bacterium]|nr:hypothetical protein [Candidatus Dojkabacteria bacterium]
LVENIPAVSAQNTKTLSQLINDKGGNTIPFEHAQTLMQSFNVSKLEDLILHLLPNWRGEKLADTGIKGIDPLVRALYEVDPMQLPKTLTQNNKRVVWLDMMSELAGEDRDLLVSGVHQNDNEMPIFSPIMNGGKWDTGSDPLILFPDKKEFVSQILSIENTQDRLLWFHRLMGL